MSDTYERELAAALEENKRLDCECDQLAELVRMDSVTVEAQKEQLDTALERIEVLEEALKMLTCG